MFTWRISRNTLSSSSECDSLSSLSCGLVGFDELGVPGMDSGRGMRVHASSAIRATLSGYMRSSAL